MSGAHRPTGTRSAVDGPSWNFLPHRRPSQRARRRPRVGSSLSAVSAVCAGTLAATALAAWGVAAERRLAGERTRLEADLGALVTQGRPPALPAPGSDGVSGRAQRDETRGRLVELMQALAGAAQSGARVERLIQTEDGAELSIRAEDGPSTLRWFRDLAAWPMATRTELVGVRAARSREGTDAVELTVRIRWRAADAAPARVAWRPAVAAGEGR